MGTVKPAVTNLLFINLSRNLTDSCQLIVLPHNTDALTQSFTELKIMGETSATVSLTLC